MKLESVNVDISEISFLCQHCNKLITFNIPVADPTEALHSVYIQSLISDVGSGRKNRTS